MKKIKESKRLKAILFFGFYLIFFSILFLGWKEKNVSVKEKDNVSTSFNISTIANSNYQYHFLINDSGILKEYHGTKEEKDYLNEENNYFFDIYNLNQLIKKSKLISFIDNQINYEITNEELNYLLNTQKNDGINTIKVLNNRDDYKNIEIDLSSYMAKEKYTISLIYKVGE